MRSAEREHSQSPRVSGAPAAAFTHTSTVMAIGDGELLRISLCLVESRRGGFFARDEEAGRGFSAQLYLEAGSRTCAPPSGPAVDAVLEASGESHRVVLVR